jgi:hypothetical protein
MGKGTTGPTALTKSEVAKLRHAIASGDMPVETSVDEATLRTAWERKD